MSQSLDLVPQQENQSIVQSFTNPAFVKSMMDFAKLISDSDLAPKDFKGKPGNTLIAIQMGLEVGLAPMQAIQNIAVINGRPCVWGDAMLAIVQNSGKLEYIKEWTEGTVAYCETKRKGYPNPHTTTFSDDDAKKAGLLGKQGPWQTAPARMRQMRARAFNLRDQFADILRGLNSSEEVQDYQVIEAKPKPITISENIIAPQPEPEIENEFITKQQRNELFELFKSLQIPKESIKEFLLNNYGIESSSQIKKEDFDAIIEWIKNRNQEQGVANE